MRKLIKLIAAVAIVVMVIALAVFTLGLGGIFIAGLWTFSSYMFVSLMTLGVAAASYLGVSCFSPSSAKEGSDAVIEIFKKASSSVGEIGGAIGNAIGSATGNVISTLAAGASKSFLPVLLLCGTGLGAFLVYRNFSSSSLSAKRKKDTINEKDSRSASSFTQKYESKSNTSNHEDSADFNKRSSND